MTSVTNVLQPFIDIANLINTVWLFIFLALGVSAAFNRHTFLFLFAFPIATIPLRSIPNFIPITSASLNNLIILLGIGFCVGKVIKWIFGFSS
jgi:hypothetical protein